MKLLLNLLCSLVTSSFYANAAEDLINFQNDDTLHGKFIGFTTSGKIIWKNPSAEQNIAFDTKDVRKVVMNKGKITTPFTHTSYVTLKNLDTIPGKVISLKDGELTLKSDFAGDIKIPKDQILNININPLGNKIIYRGPFSEDEKWELKYPTIRKTEDLTEDENEKNEEHKPWKIKNFSLHHQGQPSSILMKTEFPDQFRITFNSFSTQSHYPTLTVMADLIVPEFDKENEVLTKNRTRYRTSPANYLGSSLVIRLHPSNPSLTEYGFKEDGTLFQSNIPNMVRSISSRDIQPKTLYDLRVDKKTGIMLLFANKRSIGQWQTNSPTKQTKGTYFGYNMQYSSSSNAKSVISDIVITKWNGIRDSAISLENESRDIVMLNNGTDRYSGKLAAINESTIDLKTVYAELEIPHDQISSINISRKKAEEPELPRKNDVAIRFYGTGKITGQLSKAEDSSIFLDSKILGKINIEPEFINSIEFVNMDHAYESFQ